MVDLIWYALFVDEKKGTFSAAILTTYENAKTMKLSWLYNVVAQNTRKTAYKAISANSDPTSSHPHTEFGFLEYTDASFKAVE